MAQELQHLIDRIRIEAVEQAEKQAEEIEAAARQKAGRIIREAEAEAKEHIRKAEQEAEVFVQRSTRTLEQAARDLLITVGQGVENILSDLVASAVDEALTTEVLQQMLVAIATQSAERDGESRIDLLISEKDQENLVHFFADRYRKRMIHGVELHTDNGILKGFKVSFTGDRVYLDFTAEAIAEALGNFLRPHLAEIVSRVAREHADRKGGTGARGDKGTQHPG